MLVYESYVYLILFNELLKQSQQCKQQVYLSTVMLYLFCIRGKLESCHVFTSPDCGKRGVEKPSAT